MANRIKLRGTSEKIFDIGLTNKQTFDASALTANRTWVLPDNSGSTGSILTTNGAGVLNWNNTLTLGNLTYTGSTLTLGNGTTNGVVINPADNSITSIGANSLKLQSAGTDVIIQSSGFITSDALTIGSTVGNVTILVQPTKTIRILGSTATQYAANVTDESLVNKKYVDDLIAALVAANGLTPP